MREWDRRDQRALALIALSLKDNVLIGLGIINMTSSHEAWQALERTYGASSTAGQLFIRQRLARLRLEEGGDVLDFITDVSVLVDQLTTAGGAISESEVVAKLLTGLPVEI